MIELQLIKQFKEKEVPLFLNQEYELKASWLKLHKSNVVRYLIFDFVVVPYVVGLVLVLSDIHALLFFALACLIRTLTTLTDKPKVHVALQSLLFLLYIWKHSIWIIVKWLYTCSLAILIHLVIRKIPEEPESKATKE